MVPHDVDDPDPETEAIVHFKCDATVAGLNELEGCQLVDDFGKCFGYYLIDTIDGGAGNFI